MSRIAPAPKSEYPALSKDQRKHIGVLQERRDYLTRRAQETPPHAATYQEAEVAAINWALYLIDKEYHATV